ncbi:ABC transporter ATP-binding protein [Adlercreutzia sp. ZJ154]|uniref:ABC transporter ATP-binding protein n=1 Tax=Adlercreutzia sp. ZJ154 TaxID=2709790 RepID=UPI0013ED8CD6|nr:energy-coupling factor transporter ATPase [Adlercreutzia sp. ZJ154]
MAELSAICFENVVFSYGNRRIIDGLTLRVHAGEFVALVGENGCGKSTLLHLTCGLLQPSSGTVRIFGCSTSKNKGFDTRQLCAIVFQNPDDQLVASIVENEVAFGPENIGLAREEIRRRVTYALKATGLEGFERRQTNSLSGGQKQRLALAGALAMKPRVLLLDEASSMLDPEGRADFMRNIHKLVADGMTVLMATHSMEEAAQTDRIVQIHNGKASECQKDILKKDAPNSPVFFHKKEADNAVMDFSKLPLLLDFDNVSYTYDQDGDSRQALKDIVANLYEGEFVAVIGRTGSGKSTLIQHANGLLHPTKGRVLFREEDIADKLASNKARRSVGLVMQYPEKQLFAPTVYEDVAFGPRNLGLSLEDIDSRVCAALAQVGLDMRDFANRNPFQLSGGQKRRVAIAGVLAMKPDVLVLDEPCAGLDPHMHAEITQLLKQLHNEGQTILMVTHNMEDVEALATRVIQMRDGRIVE